ncbi:hypothetical protein [Desulfitobacterium metallireducens]|nr:hypothetical protein [Desulfitobacterium metallireducens]
MQPIHKLNFERMLIRFMVLASVLLVVAQIGLGLARDPVDFYIAMAQKIEAPPIEVLSQVSPENWVITLKATPAAPVRVLQNGKLLGTLSRGQLEITPQSGTLQLDGTSVSQIVRVQITNRDPQLHEPRLNQSFIVEKNVQNLRISP